MVNAPLLANVNEFDAPLIFAAIEPVRPFANPKDTPVPPVLSKYKLVPVIVKVDDCVIAPPLNKLKLVAGEVIAAATVIAPADVVPIRKISVLVISSKLAVDTPKVPVELLPPKLI